MNHLVIERSVSFLFFFKKTTRTFEGSLEFSHVRPPMQCNFSINRNLRLVSPSGEDRGYRRRP